MSTDQHMSGISISINNCISKLNNQNKITTGTSKPKAMHIKKLPVRSRHALFYNICTQMHVTDITTTGCHLRHRDREPSRIQVKWLTRKFGKSRLLRKRLRHNIKRSVPRSSHLHYIVENIMHCQNTRMKCIPDVYCPKKVLKKCRTKHSAKNLKFYICEGILADIFYASGLTNDLYAQQSLYGENSQFELRGINIEEVQANGDQNLNNSIRNSDLSANTKIKDEIVNYEIQFLSCYSELTNCERKRIMKKHRQDYINDFIEPTSLKKRKLETKQMKYKIMAKEKKQKLLTKNMNYKQTMTKDQKQKDLENKRVKYEAIDQSKKDELLAKNMNYKETMGEEQKRKLLEKKRAKYQTMDKSKKKELIAINSSKIMSNRMSLDPKQKQKFAE
ncbi:Hypothetical predicted protein [Paramuricea clavata]|uniref:Uncharacterized protein n=1 Tax=Paramuricea clavata TaxID=317549 RepID=A0A6S7HLV4_PARCT|nr:Hypothetical predicted protein [Paramuricea clavata]